MRGMRPSSMGCVLRAKPNKKWTRGHGMRPSNTGCVLQARDASFKHRMRSSSTGCVLQVSEASDEVSGELQVSDELFPASYSRRVGNDEI
ncbi:hypothetical protein Hanom_Chr09g00855451 [Helianthus anomalus]